MNGNCIVIYEEQNHERLKEEFLDKLSAEIPDINGEQAFSEGVLESSEYHDFVLEDMYG